MRFCLILCLLLPELLLADNLLGLPPLVIPKDNPQTPEKIALGQRLFNDKRLSADGSVSCASCHHADKAFTDGLKTAQGIKGLTGARNAPTVMNSAFYTSFFVDGRSDSLEAQALGPLTNPIEHGLKNHQAIIDIVSVDIDYQRDFKAIFKGKISTDLIAKAIASYERTLIGGNSPFDQYFFAGKKNVLSESAERGSRIFRRKGNCANCHEISWDHALFTDNRFYNIGIGFNVLKPVLPSLLKSPTTTLSALQRSETGRYQVTKVVKDLGKFKTPTLRNIALTAPYMHDGSLKTLAEVIDYYDKGGDKNLYLDAAIFPLKF
ncbi:MAG: cytochrome-c peroxidase, partial [Methylococcales bacterium]|nr:cytochrome-c peroxidase [Methylococcales bacterium]